MMYKVFAFLAVLALAAGSAFADMFTHPGVENLTADTFDSFIAKHPYVLVKFYAPWCGHCKKLAPTWGTLGDDYSGSNVYVAQIDCTTSRATCTKYGVSGFPTIRLFKNGEDAGKHVGPRTTEAFTDFVVKHGGPKP